MARAGTVSVARTSEATNTGTKIPRSFLIGEDQNN